jgi:hypothetical protein
VGNFKLVGVANALRATGFASARLKDSNERKVR